MPLSPEDQKFLNEAAEYLENPSLLLRLADAVGRPLEFLGKRAPGMLTRVVDKALRQALTVAVSTLDESSPRLQQFPRLAKAMEKPGWHSVAGAVSGAGGGFLGLPGLAFELPITTTIMLRSIAAMAKQQGEEIENPEVQLQCLAVFSLGGPQRKGTESVTGALESSYFTARVAIQEAIVAASHFVARVSTEELLSAIRHGTAPVLVQLIGRVAARFNVAVSQKLVAQGLPIVGAAGGAALNVAFIDHFTRVAYYHFGIRRLERIYGYQPVQAAYRAALEAVKIPA